MNSSQQSLFEAAVKARQQAYAPYSQFHVGASVIGQSGTIYSACNVENASYGLSKCAEINAIMQMVAAGEREIKAILVVGSGTELCSPCGTCRQIIREFASSDTPIYLCKIDGECLTLTLGELLPYSFGPENLHLKDNK